MKPLTFLLAAGLLSASSMMAQSHKPSQSGEVIEIRGDFTLKKVNDSLYWLNDWQLPYPVYQFQTGDVNGDGFIRLP